MRHPLEWFETELRKKVEAGELSWEKAFELYCKRRDARKEKAK